MTATLIDYLKRRCREQDWSVNSDDVIEFAEEYVRAHETKQPTSCAVDFGSLAAHVASARGTMIGYGHGNTAAAHSLRYVQDELVKLYETAGSLIEKVRDVLLGHIVEEIMDMLSAHVYDCQTPLRTRLCRVIRPHLASKEPTAAPSEMLVVDGLTFSQQDVDNLVAIYNDKTFTTPLQESLFRAIKVCKERLRTTEPVIGSVSLGTCKTVLLHHRHGRDYFMNDIEETNYALEVKAVLDAAGVQYE